MKTILVLSDGREISSGKHGQAAILSSSIKRSVNAGQELEPGSCSSAMLEARIFTPEPLALQPGHRVRVYWEDAAGNRFDQGVFLTEKPVYTNPVTVELTGYDTVSLLDRELAGWLSQLDGWPYSLLEFANMVCAHCGLKLKNTDFPNACVPVERFAASSVTGRMLMQWVAQGAGMFCRATTDGQIELAWYNRGDTPPIAPRAMPGNCVNGGIMQLQASFSEGVAEDNGAWKADGQVWQLPGGGTLYYYQNTLQMADYEVPGVDKVCIRQNVQDVGTVYPASGENGQALFITGNPLLEGHGAEVAPVLLRQVAQAQYTPCKVQIPMDSLVYPGDIVHITDGRGKEATVYVMQTTAAGGRLTVECTGSASRESAGAVNQRSYQSLSGKVLNLTTRVDGLQAENLDHSGALARLKLEVSGISTQVHYQNAREEALRQQMTGITQNAQSIAMQVQSIVENGAQKVKTSTGFTFNEEGLRICKDGQPMENRLDNTGMYVARSGQTILQANDRGVEATDVQVRNYLVIGSHARLEDFTDTAGRKRTACFYLGGNT